MRLVDHLMTLVETWEGATMLSRARLATKVVNQGAFFTRLQDGGSFTLATFEKFLDFFRDPANWPDGVIPDAAVAVLAQLPFGSAPIEGVSTSKQRSEVYPERLACQPDEGLDTNGKEAISAVDDVVHGQDIAA